MSETAQVGRGDTRAKGDAILDAAQRLFARFGFRRTAVDDIAREAGVAKGTVYLYFEGKEAVFRAMQRRTLAQVDALCARALEADAPFAERLRRLVQAQFGAVYDLYGQSEHLPELALARTTVGEDIASEADRGARARMQATCLAAGADPGLVPAVVETVFAAAAGAKSREGRPVSAALYAARLDGLARVAAAALRAEPPAA